MRRIKCPRCHFPTADLVHVWRARKGHRGRVCRTCFKILAEDPSARLESYALAKHTQHGFARILSIKKAVKMLGGITTRQKNQITSRQCSGSFDEVAGENLPYFYQHMHENWRGLMKVHAGNEAQQRNLNAAMESVKKWCARNGLR